MSDIVPVEPAVEDGANWLSALRTVESKPAETSPLFPFDGRDPRAAEQYRIIRTKILHHPWKPRMIAVSSPQVGDGKSVSSANLAGSLALKIEANVLLLDADFRQSSLPRSLGIPTSPGLAEVLNGQCSLREAVVRMDAIPNLCFLPAGEKPYNPAELLDSAAWKKLCSVLKAAFHFVVMDAPPVGIVADYELIQAVVDGVVVVIKPDHTNRTLCFNALDSIPDGKFIGIIVNMMPNWFLRKPHKHEYGYYAYTGEPKKP
jgi:capsular exopolysaccharide synthesis family protein